MEPEREQILEALGRIVASPQIRSSSNLTKLLRHVVEKSLGGEGADLKEYSLGVDVFGRGAGFDPRIDPIVRVEARRLRAKLEEYYNRAGAQDPVRIEIPRGAYIPAFAFVSRPARRFDWRLGAAASALFAFLLPTLWFMAGARPHHVEPSIAVLPFRTFSQDSETTYFSRGIAEEITAELSRIRGLRVASRTTVAQLQAPGTDIQRVADRLGVRTLLDGSVRKEGGHVRVQVQLIAASTGYHLWSETYDRKTSELFSIQQSIARSIAQALEVRLTPQNLVTRRTPNHEAYDLLLRARYLNPKARLARDKVSLIERALAIDPEYASAYQALAGAWAEDAFAAAVPTVTVMGTVRQAASRALELDPELAAGHLTMANVKWGMEWDWAGAEYHFQRAIDLEPSTPEFRVQFANFLVNMGRREEALRQLEAVRALDPLSPGIRGVEAAVYFLSGQRERTIQYCRTLEDTDGWSHGARFWLGRAYLAGGQYEQAAAKLEQWWKLPEYRRGRGFGTLAELYARSGRSADLRRLIEDVEARRKKTYISPLSLAQMHAATGNREEAFRWLARAVEDRDFLLATIKVEPAYDGLRDDARFKAVLRRLHLN